MSNGYNANFNGFLQNRNEKVAKYQENANLLLEQQNCLYHLN